MIAIHYGIDKDSWMKQTFARWFPRLQSAISPPFTASGVAKTPLVPPWICPCLVHSNTCRSYLVYRPAGSTYGTLRCWPITLTVISSKQEIKLQTYYLLGYRMPISGRGHTVKSHFHNFRVDAYTAISLGRKQTW